MVHGPLCVHASCIGLWVPESSSPTARKFFYQRSWASRVRRSARTVEVRMTGDEQNRYDQLARWWFRSLYHSDNRNRKTAALLTSRNETPRKGSRKGLNKTKDWRLKSLTADINLAQITRFRNICEFSLGGQQLDFDAIAKDNNDLGVSFFYTVTRQHMDPKAPPASRN